MQNWQRHNIQFPVAEADHLHQDEAYFYLLQSGVKRKIRFHDYDEIYRVQGLYEQLFYDRLKCQSPGKVAGALKTSVEQVGERLSELRVLDLGAGNGLMGQELNKYGASRIVGVDIIEEAREAAERDRPGVYDAYYVADFCQLSEQMRGEIAQWSFDCLVTVAALGFGDIPPRAFVQAFNMVRSGGWIAFNIKEAFMDRTDKSGFSSLMRELVLSKQIDLYYLERYRHRFSIEGRPLYYLAIAARKRGDLRPDFLDETRLA